MMSRLRVGVMGCSSFARRAMIPAALESQSVELVCVASRSEEKAAAVAQEFGCQADSSYEALLQRDDIDVVYMPLPTGLHEEWCIKAVEADKHLLVEKSFASDFRSAQNMVDLARSRNLLVMENFQFQTHAQWFEIKKRMNSGELGEVHLVRSTFGFPPLPKDNFRWNKGLGGGALLDAGAYMTKVSQLLLGDGLDVIGASLQVDPETGVDKYGEAMLRNNAGQVAQVAFGFDYFYQCRVELLGTEGKLTSNRVFTAPPDFEPSLTIEKQGERETISLPRDNHYINMWNWFAGEILQNGDFSHHWRILLDQARMLDQIRSIAL